MRVVLVEPYYGGSHRAWADGLVRHSRHDVALVTHGDEFWRWRMRGAALTLAELIDAEVAARGPIDVLVVSDMVDVAGLLGHARSAVGDAPVALYMHENQLLYPDSPQLRPDEAFAWTNWTSMAVADLVVCNSEHHRTALLDALGRLVRRAPDHGHAHRLADVEKATCVLPVGVESARLVRAERNRGDGPPLVVWNQRWDHDKDPRSVLRALHRLADDGRAFRLALAGENRRVDPREFTDAVDALGERVVHVGELPRDEYLDLLLRSDVVASAARHEFFGIAIVEAVAAGCRPVLPDRLSYPELIPPEHHAACLYPEGDLRVALGRARADPEPPAGLRESTVRFDWSSVAPRYDDLLESLVR